MAKRSRSSWPGDEDWAIEIACELLNKLERDPSVCVDPFEVIVAPLDGCWGCVEREPDGRLQIYIDSRSTFYRRVAIGDALGLAVILHHERFHVNFGRAEGPAYQASLEFLQRIGADELRPDLVTAIERARD
jgi:hypothetical protein